MISSGALPNVTLRSPPTPGPERAASSSVALPMSAAVGMTPSADVVKISAALACATSRAIATGMNGTRRYGHPSPLRRKRRACCTALTLHKRTASRLGRDATPTLRNLGPRDLRGRLWHVGARLGLVGGARGARRPRRARARPRHHLLLHGRHLRPVPQ